jgi:O-6-methylguanine DNA methyltransferase
MTDLTQLAVDPPAGLFDRIAARWVRVPGPTGELYLASTDHGIAYVRTEASLADARSAQPIADADARFAAAFGERFGRPLLPADRPPSGLLPALRTGRTGGLRFDLRGLPDFAQDVLRATAHIPVGQVRTYAWLAEHIGRPRAVRAVGSALGSNPVPILIGCHRVVRSDGAIGEYVFGPETKRRLLRAEGVDLAEVRSLGRRGVQYLASDTTGVVCFASCPDARRITVAHRHGFATIGAATEAGYQPCERCRPAA